MLSLQAVALVHHIVTWWNVTGGIEAYLSSQLASFSALTLFSVGWVIWPVKNFPRNNL